MENAERIISSQRRYRMRGLSASADSGISSEEDEKKRSFPTAIMGSVRSGMTCISFVENGERTIASSIVWFFNCSICS